MRRLLRLLAASVMACGAADVGALHEITGRVVDAQTGDGIARAHVTVTVQLPGIKTDPFGNVTKLVLATAEDGSFSVRNLPTSVVALWADRPGYLGSAWPPISQQVAQAQVVISGTAQTAPVALSLLRGGSIEGHALDAKGCGVASVRLYRVSEKGEIVRQSELEVDRTGQFRFGLLQSGRYYVEVASPTTANRPGGQEDLAYKRQYYGGGGDVHSAKPIDLAVGETKRIDIELQRAVTYRISGRIAGAVADFPMILVNDATNSLPLGREQWDAQTQTFSVSGLPAGNYRLDAMWNIGDKPVRREIDVAVSDSNVDGLVIEAPAEKKIP